MNAFLKKTGLIAAAAVGIFILTGVMQDRPVERPDMLRLVYYKEIGTGMTVVTISGPEGDIPQKLIEELKNETEQQRRL
jgi:hypothetical protein